MRSPVSDEGSDIEYYVGQSTYESDDKLVIALDFGTTISGIGYAFANEDKPDICSIEDWPELEGRWQLKVPTVICYDPESKAGFTWGAESHKREIIRGMELLLDPTQATPVYLPTSNTGKELERLGKPALDVVADFIGAIYEHALTIIEDKIPRDYLEMCQKQFVLSVSAVWSDRAKDLTMKAAKRAKIHPVTLIKEPETATLHNLHTLKDKALSVGDAFVICDAGGGTVDLISYKIMRLAPNLELKELVPCNGGMAGSLGLNRRFEEAVRELVGENQFHSLRKTRGFSSVVEQFDLSVKTTFRCKEDENYLVDFPMAKIQDDEHRNLASNCWHMECDDVKKILDPLITDIKRLVDEQVNLVKEKRMSEDHPKAKEIKAIFLVGGFGSSAYLKSRIEDCHPTIQIIQPHDAWAAIVKGAVHSGLPYKTRNISIVSTQSTRHYGVSADSIYDRKRDIGRPRKIDCYGDMKVHAMTWYIYRGEDLKRDQKLRFQFFQTIEGSIIDTALIFREKLLQCESTIAPIHPGETVKPNCVLRSDLSKVDRANFKQRTSLSGMTCWDIHYHL